MSTTARIKLPSGAWIQLRDASTQRRGDKKKAMSSVTDAEKVMQMAYEMTDGLLQVLIIDWSYDLPIPSESPGSLDLLPIEDDEALMEAIGPARKMIFPETPDPKDIKDEASPTEPSVG
jgi:hypothetical protein